MEDQLKSPTILKPTWIDATQSIAAFSDQVLFKILEEDVAGSSYTRAYFVCINVPEQGWKSIPIEKGGRTGFIYKGTKCWFYLLDVRLDAYYQATQYMVSIAKAK